MRFIIFLILLSQSLAAQVTQKSDTLFIKSKVVIIQTQDFNVVNDSCPPCDDQLTPGIGVLGDSCIRDDEWNVNYAPVLADSAAFYTEQAMDLFESFGIRALDDCEIDTFFVEDLEIIPPGGLNPDPGQTKEFRIHFKATDLTGKMAEATMIWIRDNSGCL